MESVWISDGGDFVALARREDIVPSVEITYSNRQHRLEWRNVHEDCTVVDVYAPNAVGGETLHRLVFHRHVVALKPTHL